MLLYIIPLLISAIIGLFLAQYLLRFRSVRGATALLAMEVAATIWSAGYALEIASPDLATNVFWAKIQYLGIVVIPPAWLIFSAQYGGSTNWLERSPINQILLWIVPALTLGLVWTNELHHLVWQQAVLETVGELSILRFVRGPWFWVYVLYSYSLLLLGSIWLAKIFRSRPADRRMIGLVLTGILIPWIGNLVYVTGLNPLPYLDWTPFSFILASLMFSLSLFRFHLLEILPIAHKDVFDGLADLVMVLDLQNRIVDLNPAAQQLAGSPASQLIGHPVDRLLGPHTDLIDQTPYFAPLQTEITMRIANVEYDFALHVSPLVNERKALIGRLVVLHDITASKRAEQELRQARDGLELMVTERTAALDGVNQQLKDELDRRQLAEHRYRALFEDAPVMYVITRNQDGTAIVVDCNQLFLDTLGYPRDEVLERRLEDFYTPSSRAELAHSYLQIVSDEIQIEEHQLLTRGGQVIETLLQAMPELDLERNLLGTRAMYLDITQRKQAEHKFQRLLESAPDAMVIVNEQNRIVLVNAQTERIFGYAREELLDQHLEMLIPARFQERHRAHMEGYFLEPALRPMGRNIELWACRQDGSEFPVEVSLSPLVTGEGLLVSSVIRDVSERKQAEEALKLQRRQLRTLARRLAEAQELERKELALELHDRVGQRLAALDLNLNLINGLLTQDLPAVDQIQTLIDTSLDLLAQTGQRVRNLMADLRPPVLDDYGVMAALDWYGNKFMASTGTNVIVKGMEPDPRLDPPVELVLFRIAQEALTNVLKHAQAKNVTIQLDPEAEGRVRLVVADDGAGFILASRAGPPDRQSLGLVGMMERAQSVGAQCRIESNPGQGTRVIVEVSR